MNPEISGPKQLLENARQQLTQPFLKTQRMLLVILNGSYLILTPVFLITEKLASYRFVPHPVLGWVYLAVGTCNLLSIAYNICRLREIKRLRVLAWSVQVNEDNGLDTLIRWGSVLSILMMNGCHMLGLGNPSSDAVLTDFALGHSLIVLVAILLGRQASFAWFLVVISLLVYVAFFQKGYSYQFNYLTPTESRQYEAALQQRKSWALSRQTQLRNQALNPPTVSRYFNIWAIFILIAYLTAYFFLGITLNVFNVIPAVTEGIQEAIAATNQQELERERERSQAEEQRLLLHQETLSAELKALKAQINPHFLYNTLHYFYIKSSEVSPELAQAILKLADIMRYSMQGDLNRVALDEEINYMNQFIALHQLRNDNKLFIHFIVSGPTADKEIPPFMLIGLVENAFKHGKMNEATDPLVIRIEATETSITFFIRNCKNQKKRVESNLIGLSNLRRRLALTYEKNYTFEVNQDEEHYSCQLIINA